MSSQAVYCLSLKIQSNSNGKTTKNNASAITKATTTTSKKAPTTTKTTKKKLYDSMQQQQQPQQQQLPHQQQAHQQQQLTTNNIILLRGSRNENGQIVIQNKHDIISFINEQQLQQNDKTTAATLTQLPTTTTVARKSIQQSSLSSTTTSCISLVANNSGNGKDNTTTAVVTGASGGPTATNTILLQTPINASQLESVLLQTANLKKSAVTLSNERPFLFRNASRSLSTDSNRVSVSNADGNKSPFVLQTLKRLEKSQSILVIRNSSSSASASSSSNLTSASSSNAINASTFAVSERKSTTPPSLLTCGGGSSTASSISLSSTSLSSSSSTIATVAAAVAPTTASVSTNTQTGALSFTTRSSRGQQTIKLGSIIANNNRTLTSNAAGTTNSAAAITSTKLSSSSVPTTTTTYLRLGNATAVAAASIFGNNKNANNNKTHNSNVTGNNTNNHNKSNRNILNGVVTETQLCLADVQLKHERNGTTSTPSTVAVVAASTSSSVATGTAANTMLSSTTQHLQLQQQQQTNAPLGSDGEPIKLPDNLESLPRADSFPSQRHRWNTNEEIAAILISFDKHSEWQSKEVKTRPKSGSLLLYSRKKVRYRRDGYCWKKRKDGKTTREDHMKLKVQGTECIYGCYVHSAILPTFHRRCYWLLQNPDIVLVHYLNVPYPDDNKMAVIAPSITLWGDKKEWTKEELVSQLKPMLSTVTSDDDSDSGNDIEISTAETVESIVCQLMEKQRLSRQAALVKQLDCGCGDASCADGKTCSHPVMRRPSLLKSVSEKRVNLNDSYNQSASGGVPNVVVGPKLYSRWSERRVRESNMDNHQYHHQQQQHHQQLTQETAIKFQIIPPTHNEQQHHNSYQQQQQQQHYRQHVSHNNNAAHQLLATRSNLIIQQHHQQQQQQQHHHQQQLQQQQQQQHAQSNFNQASSTNLNLQRFVANHNSNTNSNNNNSQINNRLQIAKTTITATGIGTVGVATSVADNNMSVGGNDNELIGNQNHMSTNSNSNKINHNTNNNNNNSNSNNSSSSNQLASQQQQQQNSDLNIINNNSNSNYNYNQQQINTSTNTHTQQQQQHFYKIQHKQTTNNIKMSSQHQQHPQAINTLNLSPSSSTSTVEPMCMSPEHHPSTPAITSACSSINGGEGDVGSNLLQQQQHLTSSTSLLSPSTSSSVPTSQSIIDDNVVNQKQSTSPTAADATTSTVQTQANLISSHDKQIDEDDVDGNNVDAINNHAAEMPSSSNEDVKQQHVNISKTNNHNVNNANNGNNQVQEYNSNSNTSDGCVNTCASSDNSTASNNIQQQQQLKCETDEQHVKHAIDFETMEINNIGNEQQQQLDEHHSHAAHELHDSLSFLNETLDLSQEDIQRTLIANMPFSTTTGAGDVVGVSGVTKVETESGVLNEIDFIGGTVSNCQGVGGANGNSDDEIPVPGGITCDPDDEDADDVFANLDAFDMLVEFPELDLDDKQSLTHTALEHAAILASNDIVASQTIAHELQQQHQQQQLQYDSTERNSTATMHYTKKLLTICDFSPEWSYPEGGVKVLVAGPWTLNANYTVLFDAQPVPTVLVQEGVLRCYCPAHEVGFATLQVSCEGFIVSNSVMFEYKMSLCQEAPFDATSNDCLYKFTLLNRLSSIDEKMQIKTEGGTLSEQHSLFLQSNLEEKLVSYCHQLTKRSWQANTSSCWTSGFKGMTLLHLAAALGYSKLVCAMLNWRSDNPNIILETEIDALSQDVHGYTPMTWACARGHIETATILYKWNNNALKIRNHAQQTPLDVAHMKGYKKLLSEIYRLEHERHKQASRSGSLGSLSLNLNKYSLNDLHSKSLNSNDELFDAKDNDNLYTNFDALDTQRSHDGVFLRPVAVASNQSPPNNSRFSKRSSVDSGINMDIRTKPGKSFKDITRLQSFDAAHDNYTLAVESPLDTLTAANTTNSLLSPLRKMDFALCEVSTGDSSPLPDKDHDDTLTINNDDITDVTINNETDGVVGDTDAKVLTLAEHIIAAMPERIKNEADEMMVLGSPMTEPLNSESSGLNDSFMDPLLDSLPNAHFDSDFNFDFNDHNYRYHDVSTPCSSLSPASSGPLQSPASYSILGPDPSVNSPSPPPSTKQLTEFLHASSNSQYPFEADFSKLTLTDTEQRELYEAAKCIQKAYRSYKGRQKLEEQNKERTAAIVIQNYYRRYKQYAYYRQMTNAALVIQHGYRSYCRNKRFKKSPTQSSASSSTTLTATGATCDSNVGGGGSQNSNTSQCLSSFYDHYKNDQQHQHEYAAHNSQPSTPKETSPSGPLKRTYSQSTQNQAARKIQQFMRQSRIKLQRERAEKEKLVHQRRAEYLQSLQYQGQQEIACHPAEKSEMESSPPVHTFNTSQLQQHQL